MADKTINEFSAGLVTNSSDAFIFQSAEGTTYKLFWSRIAEKLISDSFVEGSNITLTKNGSQMRISASGGGGSSYMPGNGISIRNGEIAVKIGDNLSFDPETGAINAQAGGGSAYTAGDGIDITNDEISIDVNGLTSTSLTATDMSSVFLLQRANGNLHKLAWGNIITQIIQQHIAAGDNVSITYSTSDIGAPIANINAADTTYTAGTGISISNAGAIGVKLGNNLSINAQTGNIDAAGVAYTEGDGIDITNDEISVDMSSLASADLAASDCFAFQQASGLLKKHYIGSLITKLIVGHIAAGSNVSIAYETVPSSSTSGIPTLPKAVISATGGGTAATIAVGTVTTGEPGTNASITNSGTSSAAVFDFVIPRGNAGANGTNGNDGSDGYSVSAVTSSITGGHRVTIRSTDPETADSSFDVMDGVTTIQTTSVNAQLTLIAAGWTGNTAPYTQTVTMSGMTSNIVPIIGLVPSSTLETGIEQEKQWGYVTKAESGTDNITFSCYKTKPTVDLTVAVKAV